MNDADSASVSLPAPVAGTDRSVLEAIEERRSRRAFADESLSMDTLATLCWAAQGVTDEDDGFRTAPSAGATYPLSVAVVVGEDGVDDLDAGVYRYRPDTHALVAVSAGDVREDLRAACLDQAWVETAPVSLVLLADPRSTVRQYGTRGRERYVPMEVGHAGQNLYLVATALDLGTVMVGAFDDEAVSDVVGAGEEESALAVYPVGVPR